MGEIYRRVQDMTKRMGAYADAGYAIPDPFCIYAAFVPLDERSTFIKVGLSMRPVERLYEIQCGSPLPIEMALWTHIGTKQKARLVELAIHQRLAPYRSRGEWFLISTSNADDMTAFNTACTRGVFETVHKVLQWRELTGREIVELAVEKIWGKRPSKKKFQKYPKRFSAVS